MFSLYSSKIPASGIKASTVFQDKFITATSSRVSMHTLTNPSVQVYSVQVMGIIKTIHTTSTNIILVFTDGKISILDSELNTTSLHYYASLTHTASTEEYLAITHSKSLSLLPLSSPHTLKIHTLAGFVQAIAFLHTFNTPTLAVLSCSTPTNATRLARSKDNMQLTVYSIDPSGSHAVLYTHSGLEYTTHSLIASPTGGVVALCVNGIYYCDHRGVVSRGVNAYFTSPKCLWDIELNSAVFLTDSILVVNTRKGELVRCDIGRELTVARLGVWTGEWSTVFFSLPFLFCGSTTADSTLLKVEFENTTQDVVMEVDELYGTSVEATTTTSFTMQVNCV